MANPYFQFKQFTVFHDRSAMKVTTDACLFGAWCAESIREAIGNGQLAKEESLQSLDIGTGTGLLSLMVAQKNNIHIDAVEIDASAAQQAEQNVEASAYANKIAVHHCDVLKWGKDNYDIILSNPPFYEKEIPSSQHQKNIAHHSEGLLLETLFHTIYTKLTATGIFYLLLPFKRKAAIDRLLLQSRLFVEKEIIVHPSESHLPSRIMLKGSKVGPPSSKDTLYIHDTQKQYSPAFTTLLKDYYLHL